MTTNFQTPLNPASLAGTVPRIEQVTGIEQLADAVAARVKSAVDESVRKYGAASLVLSGGSTPEIYLPRIASLDLPWDAVSVLLADERWVDESSAYSNTAMLRRILLSQPGPARARFVPLKNNSPTAEAGVASTRAGMLSIDQPYSIVLLGMGNDGHIASLFPGTPGLHELLAPENRLRVAAIPAPTTAAPHVERISLTLAEIRRSDHVMLVLQGNSKLDVLRRAYAAGDALQTPVVALGDVEVLWCP